MTDQEIRDTIRQMLKDWDAATDEQRAAALKAATLPQNWTKRDVETYDTPLSELVK